MSKGLKQQSAKAVLWNISEKIGSQMIFLITGVILSRLLEVGDFALIGLLAIFIALSNIFIESGLSSALIREPRNSDVDYSSVFVFNICVSSFLYAVLFFIAPLIASFYKQPSLVWLARFVFLALIFNSFGIIQQIELIRDLSYKRLAQLNIISMLIAGIIAVILSIYGFGVWALASQSVISSLVKTILLWKYGSWKASFGFRWDAIKYYLPFSTNIVLSGLVNVVFNNFYAVSIGKVFPLRDLGFYYQANKFGDVPNSVFNGPIQNVAFAAFSKVKDDEERLKRACQKSVRLLSFILFPSIIGLICTARPIFMIALGPKWEGLIYYFQLICVANIFASFSSLNLTFLNIRGYSNLVFRLEVVKVGILVISFFFSYSFGISAMLYGLIAVRMLCLLITCVIMGMKTQYTLLNQLKDQLPYLVISIVMGLAVLSLKLILTKTYLLLLSQFILGFLVYYSLNRLLGSKVLSDVIAMVHSYYSKGTAPDKI